MRAQFLSLRETDFVEAARAVGVSNLRITFRHILPNALGPVIVVLTLLMASNIVLEAFVSFLNFGIAPTEATWAYFRTGDSAKAADTEREALQLVPAHAKGGLHDELARPQQFPGARQK